MSAHFVEQNSGNANDEEKDVYLIYLAHVLG